VPACSLRAPAEAAQTAEKVTEEKSDGRSYEDQQKIADMTANSTNSFLEAWSALVEAVRNGVVKHVSKLCHMYPSISFKVMVIGVLLAYLGTADNCRQPPYILYGKVY
jgi:hypothetical protein